jgi:hypothetical protein
MKLSSRTLRGLGLAFGVSALTACDYQRYSPGVNTQFERTFVNAPGWRNEDVNRDSINYKQEVHTPIGEGSATAIKNGTVQDQINSAPAGKSSASPQAANGTNAPVNQNNNGRGNTNDVGQAQQAANISGGVPQATNSKGKGTGQ